MIFGFEARSMLMAEPNPDALPLPMNFTLLSVGLDALMRMPEVVESRMVELLTVRGPAVMIAPGTFSPAKRNST